jgi:hypothetical protein
LIRWRSPPRHVGVKLRLVIQPRGDLTVQRLRDRVDAGRVRRAVAEQLVIRIGGAADLDQVRKSRAVEAA